MDASTQQSGSEVKTVPHGFQFRVGKQSLLMVLKADFQIPTLQSWKQQQWLLILIYNDLKPEGFKLIAQ